MLSVNKIVPNASDGMPHHQPKFMGDVATSDFDRRDDGTVVIEWKEWSIWIHPQDANILVDMLSSFGIASVIDPEFQVREDDGEFEQVHNAAMAEFNLHECAREAMKVILAGQRITNPAGHIVADRALRSTLNRTARTAYVMAYAMQKAFEDEKANRAAMKKSGEAAVE